MTFADAKPYNFGYLLYEGGDGGSRPVSAGTLTANAQGEASFALTQRVSEGVQGPLTVGQAYTLVINQSSDAGSSADVIGTKTFTVKDCKAPAITTSASSVKAGSPVTISVSGAHPGEVLNFELHSKVEQLGTATADASGNASLVATIPSSVPAGVHTVVVTGEWTNLEQSLTVTETTTTPSDPDTGDNGASDDGTHKTPTVVQTDGNPVPVLWLAASALLMALTTAGGAGLIWRRVRRAA